MANSFKQILRNLGITRDKKIGPSYDDFSGDVYNFATDPEARSTLADKTPYEQPSELTAGMMGGMPPPEMPQPEQVPNVVVEPSQQIMGGVEVNPNVEGGMPQPPLPVRETMPSPSLEMPGGPRMQSVADQVIQDLTAKIGTDINKDAQKEMDDELAGTLSSFGYGAGNLFGGVGVVPSISPQSDRLPPSQLPGVDYSIEGVESLFSGAGPDATFERVPPRTNTDILITPDSSGYVEELTQTPEQREQAEYGGMDMPSQEQTVPQVQPYLDRFSGNRAEAVDDPFSTQALERMGFSDLEWSAYREGVADVESRSSGEYTAQRKGSQFLGRYQMGDDARSDAAKDLGIPNPSKKEFINNPELQERMFLAYTNKNHKELTRISAEYRALPPEEQKAVLAQAQLGATNISRALKTGKEVVDSFGTKSTKWYKAVKRRFNQLYDRGDLRGGFEGTGEL